MEEFFYPYLSFNMNMNYDMVSDMISTLHYTVSVWGLLDVQSWFHEQLCDNVDNYYFIIETAWNLV